MKTNFVMALGCALVIGVGAVISAACGGSQPEPMSPSTADGGTTTNGTAQEHTAHEAAPREATPRDSAGHDHEHGH